MSAIDFEARAAALDDRLTSLLLRRLDGKGAATSIGGLASVREVRAVIAEALRAVALEAGDAVERAHRAHATTFAGPWCHACSGHGTFVRSSDERTRCHECGSTGVADAAIVLGIARPR